MRGSDWCTPWLSDRRKCSLWTRSFLRAEAICPESTNKKMKTKKKEPYNRHWRIANCTPRSFCQWLWLWELPQRGRPRSCSDYSKVATWDATWGRARALRHTPSDSHTHRSSWNSNSGLDENRTFLHERMGTGRMRALVAAIPIAHTLERRVVVAERTQGEASR